MKVLLGTVALASVSLLMSACASVPASAPLDVGDRVLALYQDDETYYWPAVIDARNGDTVSLRYDDGDVGMQHVASVRAFDWQLGTRLECRWSDGTFYPARIAQIDSDRRSFQVLYDDGDKEATDTSRCRGV